MFVQAHVQCLYNCYEYESTAIKDGEKYSTCCRALNATAVALSAIGSYFGKDPTADSVTVVAFNALQHVEYLSRNLTGCGPYFHFKYVFDYWKKF